MNYNTELGVFNSFKHFFSHQTALEFVKAKNYPEIQCASKGMLAQKSVNDCVALKIADFLSMLL